MYTPKKRVCGRRHKGPPCYAERAHDWIGANPGQPGKLMPRPIRAQLPELVSLDAITYVEALGGWVVKTWGGRIAPMTPQSVSDAPIFTIDAPILIDAEPTWSSLAESMIQKFTMGGSPPEQNAAVEFVREMARKLDEFRQAQKKGRLKRD